MFILWTGIERITFTSLCLLVGKFVLQSSKFFKIFKNFKSKFRECMYGRIAILC